jgi:hypothetical protein
VPELRQAIAAQAGFDCDPANVIVSTGAKQVLSNSLQATLNPGDEVVETRGELCRRAGIGKAAPAKSCLIVACAGRRIVEGNANGKSWEWYIGMGMCFILVGTEFAFVMQGAKAQSAAVRALK